MTFSRADRVCGSYAPITSAERIPLTEYSFEDMFIRGFNSRGRTVTHKFSEFGAKMPPEARARSERQANEILAEMALAEMRRARGLSQEELASLLNVKQPSIAKLEQRTDMYISTL